MLDAVPHSMWLRYWFVRNKTRVASWSFWLVGLAAIGAYWPIRTVMVGQERCVTVHFSSLTVAYVLFLCYVGFFFQWLTRKYMSSYSPLVRLAAMLGLMVLLLAFLEFGLGIEMRWS